MTDQPRTAGPPAEFDVYQLVILRRPAERPTYDEATEDLLQLQHLGHFANMQEAGLMHVAGPLSDQPDHSMRGICIYQVGSVDEARRHAEDDPAVRAGLFTIDVMTWRTAKGAMPFNKEGT
ncbi:MAG: YciI family protein [Mycobacteriales bacterium]